VLALRGDPPRGDATWRAPEGGLASSLELASLAAEAGFCVLGACYPEPHPESRGWAADLAHLRAKVEAGVRVLVTQLYFDNDDYRRFIERLRAGGVDVPVLPGIIPITSIAQIERHDRAVRRAHPDRAAPRARGAPGRPARGGRARRGLRHRPGGGAAGRGRPGIHLYTLNRSPATRAVVSALRAQGALAPAALTP
jgi:methylenetetrahydrofolate reductase (NADPH)